MLGGVGERSKRLQGWCFCGAPMRPGSRHPPLLPPADPTEFGHVWLADVSPPPFGLQEVLVRGDDAGEGGRYLPRSLNVVVCVSRASSLLRCICVCAKDARKGQTLPFEGERGRRWGKYHRWLTLYRTKVFLNSTTYLGRCRLEFSFFCPPFPAPLCSGVFFWFDFSAALSFSRRAEETPESMYFCMRALAR